MTPQLLPNRFLRLPAVMECTGLKRSTIYAMVGVGNFPPPVPLGARSVGWIAAEVEDWCADRIAKRPARTLQ